MTSAEYTREQAMQIAARLFQQYGLKWTASVPKAAWDELTKCNMVLTESDRREAIGLPRLKNTYGYSV